MDSVLKIRDKKTGKWIGINAIKGDNGKSAYEQAVEGGYEGSEEEFNQMMAGFPTESHTKRGDNPHGVTAEQVGALPKTGGTVTGNLSVYKAEYPQFFVGHDTTNRGVITYYNNAMHIGCTVNGQQATLALLSDGTFKLWMSDGKGYNFYSEHNKPTASDVGALPATGGKVSGNIDLLTAFMPCIALRTNKAYTQILRNSSDDVEDGLIIRDVSDMTDNNSHLSLKLRHVYAKTRPDKALVLSVCENGTVTEYVVFSEHIKKTGTYNGSGQTTTKTVDVGGIGNMLLITSASGMAWVTSAGGWWKPANSTNINGVTTNECKYANGVLTLNTTAAALNMSGTTYTYQVL